MAEQLEQISLLNNKELHINGELRKVVQKGTFDYKEEDALMGKGGSSGKRPCSKTTILKSQLSAQVHGGRPHNPGKLNCCQQSQQKETCCRGKKVHEPTPKKVPTQWNATVF